MVWGTSNRNLMTTMNNNQQSNFKMMNNLLTLQENHVEDFFQYHGEAFLGAFEQLIEDVTTRVVCSMLSKLVFVQGSNGNMTVSPDALVEFQGITNENIQLDLQNLLASAINSEVIMQRRMAKQQYLEAQGFAGSDGAAATAAAAPSNIQGAPAMGGMNQQMMMQQQAFNNQSGYPIPPAGYDQFNNPYWIDQATGQMTYTPPQSGLGLASGIGKAVAWAKWLA
tara:strand:- start:8184 stop:8855 length:672 start_codon:yes stop_codon:yes gene_type:complete